MQALLHLPSEGAFQRSLTLLVRYRSRVVFSLPSRCLGRSRGVSSPRYSGTNARRRSRVTGLSPCIALRSRRVHAGGSALSVSPNTTLLPVNRKLRFGLDRVHSRLLTTSRSVSLPAGTEMFQFPAFPIARGNCERIPIRTSPVLTLHAGPRGLSQLGTSFVGTRAEPFTRRHSSHVCRIPLDWSSGRLDRAYTRPHTHARCETVRVSTLPTRARAEWCIGSDPIVARRVT